MILWMKDRKNRTRITIAIGDNGEPVIKLNDELVRSSVVLRLQSSGTQGLRIFSSSGELLFAAP